MTKIDPAPERRESLIDDLISEPVVIVVILMNAFTAAYFYAFPDQQAGAAKWIGWIDIACITFFIIEAGLKIYRLGMRGYFSSHWNKFDFTVTLASAPILIAPLIGIPTEVFGTIGIFRILRLLRLLRVMRITVAGSVMHFLKQPVFTVLVLFLLYEVLDSIDVAHQSKDWILSGLVFAMILSTAWVFERLYAAAHTEIFLPRSISGKWPLDPTLLSFAKIFMRLAIFFAGLILGLDAVGQDPLHLFAGLGIGGMALAFAARDLVANVIAGILVFLNRPFRMGDRIFADGTDGWVSNIGLRETVIKDFYGKLHHIPNKAFMEGKVENIDARPSYLMHMQLKLHHEMSAEQVDLALQLLTGITRDDELVLDNHWVCFDEIQQDGLLISLWYYIERWTEADQNTIGGEFDKIYLVQSRVNMAVMHQFSDAGIRLALPIEARPNDADTSSNLYGRGNKSV